MVDSHFPENVTSFGITVIISWFSRALVTVWVWRAVAVMMKKSVLRMPTALYALRLVAAEPKLSSEKKKYSKQHHDCPMSMGNKISVLWQLSTPGSLSGWLSHFGIMSTQWKAPLKFSQTQCTQDSASFMGPHNWSPIIPKVTSLSAGYQNNIGGFSTRAQAHFLKSGSTGRNICAFMKTFGKQAFFEHFHTQQRFKVRTHEQCSKVSFGPQGPKQAGVQN